MTRTLFRDARVLTLDTQNREYDAVDVRVEGSRIVEIGKDLPVGAEERIIDAPANC